MNEARKSHGIYNFDFTSNKIMYEINLALSDFSFLYSLTKLRNINNRCLICSHILSLKMLSIYIKDIK